MKIHKVVYTRKYNLGNYETEDLQIEAEVGEDNPQTVWTALADQADSWHAGHNKPAPPVTVAQPKVTVQETITPQAVTWQNRPATSLGPYESTSDISHPEISQLILKCEEEQKAVDQNGYRYWTMKKDGIVNALARRKK